MMIYRYTILGAVQKQVNQISEYVKVSSSLKLYRSFYRGAVSLFVKNTCHADEGLPRNKPAVFYRVLNTGNRISGETLYHRGFM